MNDTAWSRVLLVEGTSGVGKSTLLAALARGHVGGRGPLRTFLHLTQAHTYGPLVPEEDAGTLTRERALSHVREVAGHVSWLVDALTDERKPKLHALVDALHLTACQRPGALRFEDVVDVDEALARRGVRLLFLEASPETLWARGIEPRRDAQFITRYARKFGDSLPAIHGYFVGEQERMREDFRRSRMTRLHLRVDGPLDSYLDEARAFWLGPG
jgi:hypothetical protein